MHTGEHMTGTGHKPAVDMSGRGLLARITGEEQPAPALPGRADTAAAAPKPRVMSALGRHMYALAWFMAAWAVLAALVWGSVTGSYSLDAQEVVLANWLWSSGWALAFLAVTFGFVAFTDYRLQTEKARPAQQPEPGPERAGVAESA